MSFRVFIKGLLGFSSQLIHSVFKSMEHLLLLFLLCVSSKFQGDICFPLQTSPKVGPISAVCLMNPFGIGTENEQ